MYEPHVYYDHYTYMTPRGWLNGEDFAGTKATYPWGIRPVGQCKPDTRYLVVGIIVQGTN